MDPIQLLQFPSSISFFFYFEAHIKNTMQSYFAVVCAGYKTLRNGRFLELRSELVGRSGALCRCEVSLTPEHYSYYRL